MRIFWMFSWIICISVTTKQSNELYSRTSVAVHHSPYLYMTYVLHISANITAKWMKNHGHNKYFCIKTINKKIMKNCILILFVHHVDIEACGMWVRDCHIYIEKHTQSCIDTIDLYLQMLPLHIHIYIHIQSQKRNGRTHRELCLVDVKTAPRDSMRCGFGRHAHTKVNNNNSQQKDNVIAQTTIIATKLTLGPCACRKQGQLHVERMWLLIRAPRKKTEQTKQKKNIRKPQHFNRRSLNYDYNVIKVQTKLREIIVSTGSIGRWQPHAWPPGLSMGHVFGRVNCDVCKSVAAIWWTDDRSSGHERLSVNTMEICSNFGQTRSEHHGPHHWSITTYGFIGLCCERHTGRTVVMQWFSIIYIVAVAAGYAFK